MISLMGNDFSPFVKSREEFLESKNKLWTRRPPTSISGCDTITLLVSKIVSTLWHDPSFAQSVCFITEYRSQKIYGFANVRGFNLYSLFNPTVLPNLWIIESLSGPSRYAAFISRYVGQGDFALTNPLCNYLDDEDMVLLRLAA